MESKISNSCRMGMHCRTRDNAGNPGIATDRGLCLPCERHGLYAISMLPEDYVVLSIHLGKSGSVFGGGIPSSKSEAPIPLRIDIEALMTRIRQSLLTWERDVRYLARLSDVPQNGVRYGVEVDRAARTLAAHYSVLVSLQLPHSAIDGVDGVIELVGLHFRSKSIVGEARAWEWRELPCPGEPLSDGCGKHSLGQWLGSDVVVCPECGWSCTLDEYRTYVFTMIPPKSSNYSRGDRSE